MAGVDRLVQKQAFEIFDYGTRTLWVAVHGTVHATISPLSDALGSGDVNCAPCGL